MVKKDEETEALIASTSGSNVIAVKHFKTPNVSINLSDITDYDIKQCFVYAMKDGLLNLTTIAGEFCFMLTIKGDKVWALLHK